MHKLFLNKFKLLIFSMYKIHVYNILIVNYSAFLLMAVLPQFYMLLIF